MSSSVGCNGKAERFECVCLGAGTAFAGDVRVDNGYLQLNKVEGAPLASDCDSAEERGRMVAGAASGTLWVCMNSGWVAK